MSPDSYFNEQDIVPEVPRHLVKNPPDLAADGEPLTGRVYPVVCPDEEQCGWWGDMEVKQGSFSPEGQCPDCGQNLQVDFSRLSWGIGTRGAGYHSTAWGRRRKQDMIRRNQKLEKKQWQDTEPLSVVNPERVVNPTPGGPYDPESKFNKHKKRNSKVIYKKG
jgi:hypothetical protein